MQPFDDETRDREVGRGSSEPEKLAGIVAKHWFGILRIPPSEQSDFSRAGGTSLDLLELQLRLLRENSIAIDLSALPDPLDFDDLVEAAASDPKKRELSAGLSESREKSNIPFEGAASSAQIEQWIAEKIKPDSCEYLVPIRVKVPDVTTWASLDAALVAVINAHPSLRTSIHRTGESVDSSFVQRIHPPVHASGVISRPAICLEGGFSKFLRDGAVKFPTVEGEQKCQAVGLVDRGRIDSVLLVFHHVAVDDHSLNQIVRDLGRALEGEPCAVEQRSLLEWAAAARGGSNAEMEWWRRRLEEVPTSLNLKLATADVCSPSASEEVEEQLDSGVIAAIDRQLRGHGVMRSTAAVGALRDTLFELELASVDRVAIGMPISLRDDPSIFETTGMFLNTVPLVVERSSDLPEVARRLREAKQYRRVPYLNIVEAVLPTRVSERAPWLDACIGIMESKDSSMLPWNLLSPGETAFPILLMLKWTPGGLSLRCQVQRRFGGKALASMVLAEFVSRLKALARESRWKDLETDALRRESDRGNESAAADNPGTAELHQRTSREPEEAAPGRSTAGGDVSLAPVVSQSFMSKAVEVVTVAEETLDTTSDSESVSSNNPSFAEIFDLVPILKSFRIQLDSSLLESGLDSLAVIHLQAMIKREYGVSMRFHEILAASPREILEAIGKEPPRPKHHPVKNRTAIDVGGAKSSGERSWMPLSPIVKDVITKDAFSPSDTFHLAWRIKDSRPWDHDEFIRRLNSVRNKWPTLRSRWSVTKGARVLAGDESRPEITVFAKTPSTETQEHFLHHRMDLELADPFRVAVWPGSGGGSEALFVVHHIAADGVMASEVINDLYSIGDRQTRIASDSGELDSEQAGSDALDDVEWWINQLTERLRGAGLPRIENRSGSEAEQDFAAHNDPAIASAIEDVGGGFPHGRIAFGLAAWAIILGDRLARDRVVIGLPFATDSTHGLNANLLPIVVELADQTVSDVLGSIRRQIGDGLEHRNCSLGAIANKMSDGIGHLRPPVDGVLTIDDIAREVDGVSIRWEPMQYSAFQASVVIPNSNRETLFAIEAERGFLDGESAASMLSRWLHVMSRLVASSESQSPPVKIESISPIPPAMIEEIEAFGGYEAAFDSSRSALHLFDRVLEGRRDEIAVTDGTHSLTYAELDAWSRAIGLRLVRAGVRVGDSVAIIGPRSLSATAGFLGVLRAGGWFVPIDPEFPESRKVEQLKIAGCDLVLGVQGQGLLRENAPSGVIDIDACREDDPEQVELPGDDPRRVHGESPMYGMFTSGTTGAPRCVMVPHRAVVRLVEDPFFIRLDSRSRMLNAAPLAFDASTIEIWGPLLNGGLIAIWTGHSGDLFGMSEFVEKSQVNQCWLTTAIFNLVVDTFPSFFRSMSTVMTGGDVVSVDHVRKVMAEHASLTVVNGYGPTENTVFTACEVMPAGAPPEGDSVPIGRPIRGTRIRIVDDHGHLLPRGCFGHLVVDGGGLALGYLEGAGGPKAVGGFHRSVATGEVEYRTGDYARWTEGGILEFGGRKDSQTKLSGHRIELVAIDQALRSEAEVRDACSCIVERDGRSVLMAGVVLHQGASIEESKLRETLGQSMLAWEVPARIVVMGEIPITTNGKPDRRAIASQLADSHLPSQAISVDASGELEDVVATVAQRMVAPRKIDSRAGLRGQGFDSLGLLRLAIDLEKALGRPIPFSDILTDASVASIAAAIADNLHRESESLVVLHTGVKKCRTGVFCIPGVGGTVFSFDPMLEGLPSWCPVYGLPYPGISGERRVMSRVGDLADVLVESSMSILPKRPVLVGYSYGGFVAFEFARRIIERGHEPVVLAIDTAPISLGIYRGGFGKLRNWKLKLANVLPESIAKRAGLNGSFAMKHLRSVVAASFEAIRHYDPEPLDVPVHLLRTSETDFSPFEKIEDLGWRKLTPRVTIDYLPGRHLEVFRGASMELAQKIRVLVTHGRNES